MTAPKGPKRKPLRGGGFSMPMTKPGRCKAGSLSMTAAAAYAKAPAERKAVSLPRLRFMERTSDEEPGAEPAR